MVGKIRKITAGIAVLSAMVLVMAGVVLSFPAIASASVTGTNSLSGSVNIQSTCYINENVNSLNFGDMSPGAQSTYNTVVFNDPVGNVNGNILVQGTAWNGISSTTFAVGSTAWNNAGSGAGTSLTGAPADTHIVIPYGSNTVNVFFAVTIPAGQTAGVYSQNILITDTC